VAAFISFYVPQGFTSGVLASTWLFVTLLIAVFGLWRLLPRGFHPAEEVSVDAGLIFLPIGGVWFTMSRLGLQPLGFGDTIVLLTAVHFHFAGFAAPILAGMAGRVVSRDGVARNLFRAATVCIIIGIPLVAAGITVSPLLALIGAMITSLGLVLLAVVVLGWILCVLRSWLAKSLLLVSSLSSALGMTLASTYAYSIVAKKLIIGIPQMAMTHGIANAFGFALCGLIAWSIAKPISKAALPGIPFSKLSGWRFIGPNYFHRVGAGSQTKQPARGLVENLSVYGRPEFDPASVNAKVRSFYEETFRYKLIVRPSWKLGFRLGGRVANWVGAKLGQMRLPVSAERLEDRIESKVFALDDAVDGRTGVRAWVRTYEGTENAMYVAAYATHSMSGNTYMNIAFPIIGGNVSSILHLAPIAEPCGGIALSTGPSAHHGGDQGVYFANRLIPVRLPINEVITVWAVDQADNASTEAPQPTIRATHKMWLCGIKFLELAYDIDPAD
ncbi:MAG: YndJ family protein, partial [Acidobacteriota bacterium]